MERNSSTLDAECERKIKSDAKAPYGSRPCKEVIVVGEHQHLSMSLYKIGTPTG